MPRFAHLSFSVAQADEQRQLRRKTEGAKLPAYFARRCNKAAGLLMQLGLFVSGQTNESKGESNMFTRVPAPRAMRSTFVLVAIIASMLAGTLTAFGAATYAFADRKLSLAVAASGNIRVSGDRVVYLDKDK